MKNLGMVAWWLVIVGALNWGFEVLGFNLVTTIFSSVPVLVTVVYSLVGLSAVYLILEKFEII